MLEEKKESTTTLLKERWPHVPNEVVNNAIDICFWRALFQSTNRYTTKRALDDFGTMASGIIEQRKVLSCGVIESILLEHYKKDKQEKLSNELAKGLRSIPTGILIQVLKSVNSVWTDTTK
jgi:hypothetical protein